VAAPAQNGDGLRTDQASAADDDDLHGLPSLVDHGDNVTFKCWNFKRWKSAQCRANI
jgi:hypothetical protein